MIICSKAAKVTSKQCGCDINRSVLSDKAFQSYSCVIYWIFVYLTYHFTNARSKLSFSRFSLRKMSTLTSKQLSAKRCSHVIVLLGTAETVSIQSLMKTLRSGHLRCSIKKVILKNLATFSGKHLCQSLFFRPQACSFIKKETLTQVFSCEFCEIFKNTF